MERITGRGELVIGPKPFFPSSHKPRLSQICQVARCFGLRDAKHVNDVADAKFATRQQVKDSQAGTIRKRPEHYVNAGSGLAFHIRLREYSIPQLKHGQAQ